MTTLQTRSAEQAELEQLVHSFFEAVSFEHGSKPNYPRIHQLFIDDGLLIKNSGALPEITTPGAFIEPRQASVDAGDLTRFFEAELSGLTQVFGNVAHRLSAYEKSGELKGAAFQAKGMVSTQFIRTPEGWRISSMAWDDERPGLARDHV